MASASLGTAGRTVMALLVPRHAGSILSKIRRPYATALRWIVRPRPRPPRLRVYAARPRRAGLNNRADVGHASRMLIATGPNTGCIRIA